jgi:hypothetical protein
LYKCGITDNIYTRDYEQHRKTFGNQFKIVFVSITDNNSEIEKIVIKIEAETQKFKLKMEAKTQQKQKETQQKQEETQQKQEETKQLELKLKEKMLESPIEHLKLMDKIMKKENIQKIFR